MSSDETSEWNRRLKAEWEERARSPMRDFFIASHRGWDDPEAWDAQARADVGFAFSRLEEPWLSEAHLLEVGCGVGRLVPHIRPKVASYTGTDISPSIVEEARRRCESIEGARFFETDGSSIPVGAVDREYDLILIFAVFIHCPLEVIRETLEATKAVIAPGGRIRFSIRGDSEDHEGIVAPVGHVEEVAATIDDTVEQLTDMGVEELVNDRAYTGHGFRYAEAKELMEQIFAGDELMLVRTDPFTIYVEVTRDA